MSPAIIRAQPGPDQITIGGTNREGEFMPVLIKGPVKVDTLEAECSGCTELAKRVEELERIVLRRRPDRHEREAERQRLTDGI
jgi:hypothetical protein